MQPARKDDPNLQDTLPDPRLNPMINPRLGKNLGRWASVYYTTPPEQRDQAVLALVRELEGGEAPAEDVASASCRPKEPAADAPDSSRDDGETQPAVEPAIQNNPLGPVSAAPQWRFCGHCGSPLKKKAPAQPSPTGPLLGSEPRPWLVDPTPHEVPLSIEDDSAAPDNAVPKPRRRAQILFVLLLSIAVGAWGLRHIRSTSASPSTARVVPIVKQPATPAAPVVQPRIRQTVAPPSPPLHDSPAKLSKPAAGTPIGCTSDHLSNCRPDELYRRSMSLADGIDARFLAYDKRINQLLRDATAHSHNRATTRPDRLRQANYSAQLWEQLQLKAYATHEKRDALKLRAELTRKAAATPKPERNLLRIYQNPQSCLELHYIADDLRRLAARMPKSPPYTLRASARKLSNSP